MTVPTRRTTSLSGTSRLSLSVSNKPAPPAAPAVAGRHPLRHDWSISYVHRPPGTKVDYEKEVHKVATFGSGKYSVFAIESFLHLYAHLTSPAEVAPVTDILCFVSRIQRPGIWEEMVNGGKFTIRLLHSVTPALFESLLFSMIGDQFEEADTVVGCVLSVRQTEDILSVWVEEEGEAVRSGALREKILQLLNLPPTTVCEYRSNKALLDASMKDKVPLDSAAPGAEGMHGHQHSHHQHSHQHTHQVHGHQHSHQVGFTQHTSHGQHPRHQQDRPHYRGPREDAGAPGERRTGWGNGFRREQ